MPAYTTITNGLVAVGAKPFATTIQALRDNPLAIAEKDPTVPFAYTIGPRLLGAGVTASGTQIDFTGIPSVARRVTVLVSGLSHNSGLSPQFALQIGDSGGIETTGYTGLVYDPIPTASSTTFSTNFVLTRPLSNASIVNGRIVLECVDPATNLWVSTGQFHDNIGSISSNLSGSKALSAALDRVRLLVSAGSFDAGTVNVSTE